VANIYLALEAEQLHLLYVVEGALIALNKSNIVSRISFGGLSTLCISKDRFLDGQITVSSRVGSNGGELKVLRANWENTLRLC
jgi:hypothetical protein